MSVPITHPGLLAVAVLPQVQNCSLLLKKLSLYRTYMTLATVYMYQVLHDTNNVIDRGCHCVSADHSSRVVGSGSVASSSELFTVVRPSI